MKKASENAFKADIEKLLNSYGFGIQQNMEKKAVNASGETSASKQITATDTTGKLEFSEVLLKIETGTPPKSQGGSVDFYDILQWISDKPLIVEAGFEKAVAGRITDNIRKLGTFTYQKGGRTDIFTDLLADTSFEALFLNDLGKTTVSIIMESLNDKN